MRLVLFTQNEGPFRMRWMDELAKYMEVCVYHIGEYETDVNMAYISYKPKRAKVSDVGKTVFGVKIYDIGKAELKKGDLILLDGYGFKAQQQLVLWLLRRKMKYGITVDGGFIPARENWVKYAVKRAIISKASFCFSTGKETDRFLLYYGVGKNRIRRHYFSNILNEDVLAAPLSEDEKKARRKTEAIDGDTLFMSVGKMTFGKGFGLLSDALYLIDNDMKYFDDVDLKKIWDGCRFLIIGGSDADCAQEKTAFHEKIVCLPFMNKDKLNSYYEMSDIFILPTRKDVWGLVISEAMAKGLPVITTDMCLAGKSMVRNGKNGYIVPAGNRKALADAIKTMLQTDRGRMGRMSIRAAKQYTIEHAAKADGEILKDIYSNW